MRRILAGVIALLLGWPWAFAEAVGNCSPYKTWGVADTLTAGDLNSSMTTAAVTNWSFACLDDYAINTEQMGVVVDPFLGGTESLATSGSHELARLRFALAHLTGQTNANFWYTHAPPDWTQIVGTGATTRQPGRHVLAVGLHVWSGSSQLPVITSTAAHRTGFAFPAAHHVALMIEATPDSGRFCCASGQTNARTFILWHAAGMILHHTATLRFAHSEATMHNGQRGHVTALAIDPTDTLVVGHAGAGLQIWAGARPSHITLGSGGYVALDRHLTALAGTTFVPNAIYADRIVKGWVVFNGELAGAPVNQSFNVASITDTAVGRWTVTWSQAMSNLHYAVGGSSYCLGSSTVQCAMNLDSSGTVSAPLATGSAQILAIDQNLTTLLDCRICGVFAVGQQ